MSDHKPPRTTAMLVRASPTLRSHRKIAKVFSEIWEIVQQYGEEVNTKSQDIEFLQYICELAENSNRKLDGPQKEALVVKVWTTLYPDIALDPDKLISLKQQIAFICKHKLVKRVSIVRRLAEIVRALFF